MSTLIYEEYIQVGPNYIYTDTDTDTDTDDENNFEYEGCNGTNTCQYNTCIGDRNLFCYALCEYNIICHCDNCRQTSLNGFCLPGCSCAMCFHYRNCYDTATCNCREKSNAMYIATFCKDWTQDEVAEHHSDSKDTGDANYDSDSDYDVHERVYPTIAHTHVVFDCGNCGVCLDCMSTFPCGCMDVCLCDGYDYDYDYD